MKKQCKKPGCHNRLNSQFWQSDKAGSKKWFYQLRMISRLKPILSFKDLEIAVCHESCPWSFICSPPEVAFRSHRHSHHTDCYMSPRTTVPIIHCTDYTHIYTIHSCNLSNTIYKPWTSSFGSPSIVCFYHSPSDSNITEPFRVSWV